MADKKKLVVIEEGALTAMSTNQALVAEFPFLKGLIGKARVAKRGCGRCGREAERTSVFGAAKQAIASMDSTKKRRLKEVLKAQALRVTYRNSRGRIEQLTF